MTKIKRIISVFLTMAMLVTFSSNILVAAEVSTTSESSTLQMGDINGDGQVMADDAMILLQSIAGSVTLTSDQIALGDINGDGEIMSDDIMFIVQSVAGLYELPEIQEPEVEDPEVEEEDDDLLNLDNRALYSTLSEEDKVVYEEVATGLMLKQSAIVTSTTDSDYLFEICDLVKHDFPELFWFTASSASSNSKAGAIWTLHPTFDYTVEEIETMEDEIDAVVDDFIDTVPSEATDYEIVKMAYEYIIINNTYEFTDYDQTVYGSLVEQESVCAGYARAMQYILGEFDIMTYYVTGYAYNGVAGEAHAWTYVELDDGFYFVDATWGDSYSATPENPFVNYKYFCGVLSTYSNSHFEDDSYDWPDNFGSSYIYS